MSVLDGNCGKRQDYAGSNGRIKADVLSRPRGLGKTFNVQLLSLEVRKAVGF